MIYVDLNPVRAKMAESIEDFDHTSGQDRLLAESTRQHVSGSANTADARDWKLP